MNGSLFPHHPGDSVLSVLFSVSFLLHLPSECPLLFWWSFLSRGYADWCFGGIINSKMESTPPLSRIEKASLICHLGAVKTFEAILTPGPLNVTGVALSSWCTSISHPWRWIQGDCFQSGPSCPSVTENTLDLLHWQLLPSLFTLSGIPTVWVLGSPRLVLYFPFFLYYFLPHFFLFCFLEASSTLSHNSPESLILLLCF